VPQASADWVRTKAAYRLWDNTKVSEEGILEGHRSSVIERMKGHCVVLAVQDTTDFNFSHHKAKDEAAGFGPISAHEHVLGLKLHTTFAVSGSGVPLGVLDQQSWARKKEKGKGNGKRQKATAGKGWKGKESLRWLKAQVGSELDVPEGVKLVTVADRESDIYELMALERSENVHVLLRVCRDRKVDHPEQRLKAAMTTAEIAGEVEVEVSAKKGQSQRSAKLTVRYQRLTFQVPANRSQSSHLAPVSMTVLWAVEENPPQGCKAIDWMLVSDLEVKSFEGAGELLRWYALRWLIERYHYSLKSGCHIEQLQLQTAERIVRAVATYAIVAWRLLWLTYEARVNPNQSCEAVLETAEWQSLFCSIHNNKKKLPKTPPTLQQAVRWIAQLGGFLGRRHDGQPGVKVLWRGLSRLQDIARSWQLALAQT
jgi:hypothetical protein